MDDALLAQLSALAASLVLLFGITLLWRRSLQAYIDAFSMAVACGLTVIFVVIGYFGDDPELYVVAIFFFVLKVLIMPCYLERLQRRFGSQARNRTLPQRCLLADPGGTACAAGLCHHPPAGDGQRNCPRAAVCRWRWG